tara:strand:- start:26231 stop:26953 length:723 start_codon:yes stop_codon:yes gene_type:complete
MSRRRTTSELFGLTPDERTALINTIAGEAYQGGAGKDIAAVAANVLSRRVSNYDGKKNIVDLVMAPGQYAANDYYNRDQIISPNLISKFDRDRIAGVVDNPSMVLNEYMAGGGPVSFRGTSLYKNRRGDEYTPIEGSSNFYFDPLKTQNPAAYQRGLDMFQGVTPVSTQISQVPTQTAADSTNLGTTAPEYNPRKFVVDFLQEQIKRTINQQNELTDILGMEPPSNYIDAKTAQRFFDRL